MATTNYNTLTTWDTSMKYTATAQVDVLLSNAGGGILRWTITTSDALPTISVSSGHPIKQLDSRAMTLNVNDRLWVASYTGNAVAALEV